MVNLTAFGVEMVVTLIGTKAKHRRSWIFDWMNNKVDCENERERESARAKSETTDQSSFVNDSLSGMKRLKLHNISNQTGQSYKINVTKWLYSTAHACERLASFRWMHWNQNTLCGCEKLRCDPAPPHPQMVEWGSTVFEHWAVVSFFFSFTFSRIINTSMGLWIGWENSLFYVSKTL